MQQQSILDQIREDLASPVPPTRPVGERLQYISVSPVIAQELLALGGPNRRLVTRHAEHLAQMMESDNWHGGTGEAIKVTRSNKLADGLHRLTAVVLSGATIRVLLIWGVPDDAQPYMDTGRVRRGGDVLSMAGYSNANNVAAAAKVCIHLAAGRTTDQIQVSPQELMAFADSDPTVAESVQAAVKWSGLALTPATLAGAVWLLNKVDPDACVEFFSKATSMSWEMPYDEPIRLMVERLHKVKTTSVKQIRFADALFPVVFAWNAWRVGEYGVKSIPPRKKTQPLPNPV